MYAQLSFTDFNLYLSSSLLKNCAARVLSMWIAQFRTNKFKISWREPGEFLRKTKKFRIFSKWETLIPASTIWYFWMLCSRVKQQFTVLFFFLYWIKKNFVTSCQEHVKNTTRYTRHVTRCTWKMSANICKFCIRAKQLTSFKCPDELKQSTLSPLRPGTCE